ncbi:hypothetical protein [Stenotrophomonas sp.]|uniref:hypothetical protein n=1 Tax=Stenotrophomonas sp. TaxID=69392 RepID=UPI0028AF9BA1|nr:hypothetical protein [Stenotrophomonas sp.]
MSTAAANGHAEGYQAGYADAVKAVEAGKDAAAPVDLHAHLLHMLGAKDHEDAGRIIGELHAASMSTPAAPGFDVDALAQEIRRVDGGHSLGAGALAELLVDWMSRQVIDASPKGGSDAIDAARWRYVRQKLCLSGNGDGTCQMQAINLPAAIPGWPESAAEVCSFCDSAIDAAMQATSAEVGA